MQICGTQRTDGRGQTHTCGLFTESPTPERGHVHVCLSDVVKRGFPPKEPCHYMWSDEDSVARSDFNNPVIAPLEFRLHLSANASSTGSGGR